ncbi:MAG: cysteine desulfurase [Deltaproteobacteria bacterium]|nr:cysteine desulfurase [Deltaproteobacteria bacterium]
MIYLDHNATTPVLPEVFDSMRPFFCEQFGNASSFYTPARAVRAVLEGARNTVASAMGATAEEIIFTASGTESDNLALRGVSRIFQGKSCHIITSSVEHHAVLRTCDDLEAQGISITRLAVDSQGRVDPDDVRKSITPHTVLISIMNANNETGVMQPVKIISEIARNKEILFHTDAVQAFGKTPLDVHDLGADLMTVSAHKIYGPKGVGALYIRKGTKVAPLITGGEHEHGMRAGTENIPAIVGFAKAAELATSTLETISARTGFLRDCFENQVRERIDNVSINGMDAVRVPNTTSVTFHDIDGESVLLHLDLRGIYASTGSACATGSPEPSHVLCAMGLNKIDAQGTLRFSLGKGTTQDEMDSTVQALVEIVETLRDISSIHI